MIETRHQDVSTTYDQKVSLCDVVGQPVAALTDAAHFLLNCRSPHRVRLRRRHLPADLDPGAIHALPSVPSEGNPLAWFSRRVLMLEVIQRHTPTLLRMPDFDTTPVEEVKQWWMAAQLLSGQTLYQVYDPDQPPQIVIRLPDVLEPDTFDNEALVLPHPLSVDINGEHVDLGEYSITLHRPRLVTSHRQNDGSTTYTVHSENNRVEYSRGPRTDVS